MSELETNSPDENHPVAENDVSRVLPYASPGAVYASPHSKTLITIGRYSSVFEASMHAARLEDAQIVCHVLNANVNGLGIPYRGLSDVELQVHVIDAARAREILEDAVEDLEPDESAHFDTAKDDKGNEIRVVQAGAFENVKLMRDAQTVLASANIKSYSPRLISRGDRPHGEGKRFILRVTEDDADRAERLLSEANDDDEAEGDPRCPQCSSWRVGEASQLWESFKAFWGIGHKPPKHWQCFACGHRGPLEEFET